MQTNRTEQTPLKRTSKGKITHSSAECVEFKEESVGHLISECSKLAQNEYKYQHDNVARIVPWDIS